MAVESDPVGPVVVWTCPLDAGPLGAAALAPVTEAERSRALRYRSPEHREAALARAALTRWVLAAHLGVEPGAVRLTRTCRRCGDETHGKPALSAPPSRPPVHFNLSHSAGLAVLAVGPVEVGVDVEHRSRAQSAGVTRLVLSPEEQAGLAGLDGEAAGEAFLRLWTRKEAYLKGIGTGLVDDPAQVSFGSADGRWHQVLARGAATPWSTRHLAVGDHWVAAVAVAGGPRPVTVRRWSPPGN